MLAPNRTKTETKRTAIGFPVGYNVLENFLDSALIL